MRAALIFSSMLLAQGAFANVVGPGSQNFNPTTDGLDYVTVQSSKTLSPGIVNLGFFLNDAINTLPYLDSGTQSKVRLNDTVLGADFNAGIGIMDRLDAGLSFPFILAQSVSDQGDVHGQFTSYGNTEVRANVKYRLLGHDDGGLAVVGTVNFNRTQDDPFTGTHAGPTTNLEFVADKTFHRVSYALNAGHRWRDSGPQVDGASIEPLGDQWIFSTAASYLLTSLDTKVIGEIFGAAPDGSETGNAARSLTSLELIGGVKHDYSNSLALHAGGGAGLLSGVSSPDWRVYAGLNYTFETHRKIIPAAVAPLPPTLEQVPQKSPNIEVFRSADILFKFGSDELTDESKDTFNALIEHLNSKPYEKLLVDGHTDSVGPHEYNMTLSLRRAESVKKYLVANGIPDSKVDTDGFGPDLPIADNGNFQGRQKNRRVEFTVIRAKGAKRDRSQE